MAITTVYGMTQSGKSYFSEHTLIEKWRRKIILDKARCFKGENVFINPDSRKIMEIYRKFRDVDDFKLIFRPSDRCDLKKFFDRVVELALMMGEKGKKKELWTVLVVDEADNFCTSNFQPMTMKYLVNEGRHNYVDSVFIARNPNRLHTDIRTNASLCVSFFIQNALSVSFFKENFTREIMEKIANLPKYWRLEWDDTGLLRILDDKGRIYEEFKKNPDVFPLNKHKKLSGNR